MLSLSVVQDVAAHDDVAYCTLCAGSAATHTHTHTEQSHHFTLAHNQCAHHVKVTSLHSVLSTCYSSVPTLPVLQRSYRTPTKQTITFPRQRRLPPYTVSLVFFPYWRFGCGAMVRQQLVSVLLSPLYQS